MMQQTGRVHPAVLRKMRNLAIKQAISELSEKPTPTEVEKTAKRHLLSYTELKQAYNRELREKKTQDS
jgi:hypothetical protein